MRNVSGTPVTKIHNACQAPLWARLSVILVVSMMLGAAATRANAQMRRDGEYWRSIPETEKLDIILGLFDGMTLSESLLQIVLKGDGASCSKRMNSIFKQTSKYLDDLTTSQISSGLDAFYEEEANRRIPIFWGVWVVARQAKGGRDVDTFVAELRRSYR